MVLEMCSILEVNRQTNAGSPCLQTYNASVEGELYAVLKL